MTNAVLRAVSKFSDPAKRVMPITAEMIPPHRVLRYGTGSQVASRIVRQIRLLAIAWPKSRRVMQLPVSDAISRRERGKR